MRIKFIITQITILVFSVAIAQQKSLSISQAVDQALKANFDVIRSSNLKLTQEYGISSARWALVPNINFSSSGSQTKKSESDAIDQFLKYPNPSNSFATSFSTSVVLFDGMSNWENVTKAANTFESSNFDHVRVQQLVVFEVQRRYLTLLRTKSLLQVNEDNLKRSQQQLKRIEESVRIGAIAKADLYRQQVTTANDELNLIKAKNTFDNSYADLLSYISLDVNEEYLIQDVDIENEIEDELTKELLVESKNIVSFFSKAIASRPDFQSNQIAITNSSSDIAIARSTFWPTISANASFSTSEDTLSNLGKKNNTIFGLNISFPLFSGFKSTVAVQQAELRLKTSEEQLLQTKRKIHVEVKKAVLDLESTQKQREVSQKNIIASTEDRRIAEERYSLGAGSLLDLLIANANHTRSLSDKVNADYDFLIAKHQLVLSLGQQRY
ncbi:MAG: TolC family protein [Bacteroidetes bacterium]|nr:TolC family protein [Bacteroidota bacterium]